MKYKLIGDVHTKFEDYINVISYHNPNNYPTIQIGDFGFKQHHDLFKLYINSDNNKILFGNHDYYPYKYEKHSLGDWGILNNTESTFFIRGAHSIDWKFRIEGLDWFKDEEFTYKEYDNCFTDYLKYKPKIVITHDCPNDVILHIYNGINKYPNSTNTFFQTLFENHKPDLWIFGHHHISLDVIINGTRFVCLSELEHKDFELI